MTITPQLVHAPSVHRATALAGASLFTPYVSTSFYKFVHTSSSLYVFSLDFYFLRPLIRFLHFSVIAEPAQTIMAMDFGMPAISASISTASTLKLIIALATIAFAFGVVIPITDIANTDCSPWTIEWHALLAGALIRITPSCIGA